MFRKYIRTNIAEMRPYKEGETLSERVSISAADLENGSPKTGDMIARNPQNHEDQWLIAEDYFKDNFDVLTTWDENANQYAECKCGHAYERHFPPYDDSIVIVGCEYCPCGDFDALEY